MVILKNYKNFKNEKQCEYVGYYRLKRCEVIALEKRIVITLNFGRMCLENSEKFIV